jgi:glucokinase
MARLRSATRALGLDIGGTAIKAGAADERGQVLAEARRETGEELSYEGLLDRCCELVRELGPDGSLGLGVPGLLDNRRGLVFESPNLPELNGRELGPDLAVRLGREPDAVRIENDANAAALGEGWVGAGATHADFLLVTLGTGIGGGLVLGGELVVGAGLGCEIGHVKIARSGPTCGCGRTGCLETFASASAAERRAREAGLTDDLEQLAERARAASGPERELLRDVGHDLGLGLAAAVNLLDLRAFIVGGGFSAALDMLEPGVRTGLDAGSYGARLAGIDIHRATLGPRAGWIGAARVGLGPASPPQ